MMQSYNYLLARTEEVGQAPIQNVTLWQKWVLGFRITISMKDVLRFFHVKWSAVAAIGVFECLLEIGKHLLAIEQLVKKIEQLVKDGQGG